MSKHILIIGAVALGPKAASRFRRLDPHAKITMIDQNEFISYGGCGIPYYISGEVNPLDALRSTGNNTIRDAAYFKEYKDIDVRTKTRALAIDTLGKSVLIEDLQSGKQENLSYDKLVLATGSIANIPPFEGVELGNVMTVTSLESASTIREACEQGKIKNAVIVGAGFIGLEMAVALADAWKIPTSVVEFAPQAMPGVLSPLLADMVKNDFAQKNVTIYTEEKVLRLEADPTDPSKVARVVTDKQNLDADLVILATGYRPNATLADEAGLLIDSTSGGIVVNEYLQTSDPDIYAGGDCVALTHLVTGKNTYLPLGSQANRQGRVVGSNLAGAQTRFDGVVGTWCVKLFGICAAGTGLTFVQAKKALFDAVAVNIEQFDRAHFYPEKTMMSLELIVDRPTRRILGVQGISTGGDALKARIDTIAAMLQFGKPTIDDLANVEVAYSPPLGSAMDIINTLANVADNVLSGRMPAMQPKDFARAWEDRANNNIYFADARPEKASQELADKYPGEWNATPLEKLHELPNTLPKDRHIAFICNSGLRASELILHLKKHGFSLMRNRMVGMQVMNKCGKKF